jgi:hypothetical protein
VSRDKVCGKQELRLTIPQIPPRSRLYNIEPIALGTARVESLTSYIIRLAEAHSLTPNKLCRHEIVPVVGRYQNKKVLKRSGADILSHRGILSLTPVFNGLTTTAREWVRALELLTMRSDLSFLTMLAWKDTLSPKELLRPNRVWCPTCYEEERAASRPVYEPLMWCFQAVTACCRHRRVLKRVCPWCNRTSYPLASKARTGFCFSCRQWLGESADKSIPSDELLTDAEFEWQSWVTVMLGDLLTAAHGLNCKLSGAHISNSISACVERAAGGKSAELARMSKIAAATITYWRKGKPPRLSRLLRVCFQSKVTLLNFLTGTIPRKDILDRSSQPPTRTPSSTGRRPRERYTFMDRARAKAILRNALKEVPPPSLQQILTRIGRRSWPASKYFPRLSKAVINRHATYRERLKAQTRRTMTRALKTALKSKRHPSPAEVARELGCSPNSLKKAHPELFRSLSEWHVVGREKRWQEVGITLRAMLEESPPVSRYEMERRIGFSAGRISARFPELCGELSARFLKYLYNGKKLSYQ